MFSRSVRCFNNVRDVKYTMIVKLSLRDVERARLVLRGGSVLDWRRLNITSLAEGDVIWRVNGFDPENEEDSARLKEIRLSAIEYLAFEGGEPDATQKALSAT
jgi:uncharacterized protein (TIGR04552 family)